MSVSISSKWEKRRLIDIAEVILGQSPPSDTYNKNGKGLPFFQGKAEFTEHHPVVRQFSTASKKIAEVNDILLSVRAPIGPTNVADQRSGIGRGLAAIRYPNSYRYLLYYFKLIEKSLDSLGTGTTFRAITGPKLKSLEVPFPPLEDQEEVVAKIEELFSELDKTIRSLGEDLKRCDSLKTSIIEYSFLRAGGKKVELSDVTVVITDGDHQAPPKAATGVPFIVISNIQNNRVLISKATRYVPLSYYNALKDSRKAKTGDVLYTVTGSYGVPALIENNDEFCFQRHIALLRPDSSIISSKYLLYALQTDSAYKQSTSIATGTAQLTVPLTGLRKITINLISLDRQQAFVEQIEMKLSELEALRSTIINLVQQARSMKQSILVKAFKGELV